MFHGCLGYLKVLKHVVYRRRRGAAAVEAASVAVAPTAAAAAACYTAATIDYRLYIRDTPPHVHHRAASCDRL